MTRSQNLPWSRSTATEVLQSAGAGARKSATVMPEGQLALQLDVHGNLAGGHDARVDHVGDGAGIVHRRVVEALGVLVGLGEELHQFHHELGRLGAHGGDLLDDLGGGQGLVREVQAHHHHGPLLVEDDVRGLGVDDDVEFGHGAPVAHVVAAAHEDNFLDALNDARLLAGGHGDVGEACGGDQGHGAGLVRHDRLDDEVDGVARVQLDGGLGLGGAVHAGFAVDVRRGFDGAHQRAVAAGGKGDAGDAGDGADGQGVAGDLFQGLVAHHGGDGKQLDVRVAVRQQQRHGVVMPGVAVQDDLLAARGHGVGVHVYLHVIGVLPGAGRCRALKQSG